MSKFIPIVILLFLSGCVSVGRRQSVDAGKFVKTARSQVGKPYRYQGASPKSGFDCSGLVRWSLAQQGVKVPHSTLRLWGLGSPVKKSSLRPGDLVFFDINGDGPSHVGVYSGKDHFVHAPKTGGHVREELFSMAYWKKRFLGGRRL